MDPWSELLAGARLADIALGALVAEAVVLLVQHARTGRGLPALDLLSVMLPGAFLLLALRSALAGSGSAALSGFLVAALLAHLADMRRRWRQHDAHSPDGPVTRRAAGRERLQTPD